MLVIGLWGESAGQGELSQVFESEAGNRVTVTITEGGERAYQEGGNLHLLPGSEFTVRMVAEPQAGWTVAGDADDTRIVVVPAAPQHPTVSAGVAVFEPEDAAETAETLLARVRVIVPEVVGFTMVGFAGADLLEYKLGGPGLVYLGTETKAIGVLRIHPSGARHHFAVRLDNWVNALTRINGVAVGLENNPHVGRDEAYLEGQEIEEGPGTIEVSRFDHPGFVNTMAFWQGVAGRGDVVTFDFRANVYLQWSVNGQDWNPVAKLPWYVNAIVNAQGVAGGVASPVKGATIDDFQQTTEAPEAPASPEPPIEP